MTLDNAMFEYLLRMGDDTLILGQRLAEWCGHAHQLETDIALTNIALDQIGQARLLLSRAGELENKGRDEDKLAFHRDEHEFKNLLIVELENGDFAQTITRQYLVDVYRFHLLKGLKDSPDEFLSAYAAKSFKEVAYHKELSGDWVVRLGDGTEMSHRKMQDALDMMWEYTGEFFEEDEVNTLMRENGLAPDVKELESAWKSEVENTLKEATLVIPDTGGYMATGGRSGRHTEYMGYILAEMQYLPRTMPEATW